MLIIAGLASKYCFHLCFSVCLSLILLVGGSEKAEERKAEEGKVEDRKGEEGSSHATLILKVLNVFL